MNGIAYIETCWQDLRYWVHAPAKSPVLVSTDDVYLALGVKHRHFQLDECSSS